MKYNDQHLQPRHLARLLHNQTGKPLAECRLIVELLADYEARIISQDIQWDTTKCLALYEKIYADY